MGRGRSSHMEINRVSFGKDRFHQQSEMIAWCESHSKNGGWRAMSADSEAEWAVDSMFGATHFFFRNPKDLVLFSLRWT